MELLPLIISRFLSKHPDYSRRINRVINEYYVDYVRKEAGNAPFLSG